MQTTTQNKQLSKINEKISDLATQILEIESYNARDDFDTRENSICANIKVYEWLEEDDVKTIIKKENLQANEFAILDEFNEERLSNIYNHLCEMEVEYLKERYEQNCDVSNPYKSFHLYQRFLESDFKAWPLETFIIRDKNHKITNQGFHLNKWRHNEFVKFSKRKNNSLEDFKKDYIKRNKWEYEEFEHRSLINFECWQYGRSGGWFSVCRTSELENEEFESYEFYTPIYELKGVEDNKDFNRILNEEFEVFSNDKPLLINQMQTFIDNWTEKKESIEYYIKEIEDSKKHFKSGLIERLQDEILTYVTEDLNAEESNVSIKIQEDKIKTTLGVLVDLNAFKVAFRDIKPLFNTLQTEGQRVAIKRRVGGYFVEFAKKTQNDILIKAGCHRFSLNNIQQVILA